MPKTLLKSLVSDNCKTHPIQRKYIPDLAAASETAATLLASLNKGGGEKKGGSEAFFTNSAENFLAAIIYFFVNFHPTGFKNGKKLTRFIQCNGQKLRLRTRQWSDFEAVDSKDKVVLDFINQEGRNVSTDEDNLPVDLNGFNYVDLEGKLIIIDRSWYEDESVGNCRALPFPLPGTGAAADDVCFSLIVGIWTIGSTVCFGHSLVI